MSWLNPNGNGALLSLSTLKILELQQCHYLLLLLSAKRSFSWQTGSVFFDRRETSVVNDGSAALSVPVNHDSEHKTRTPGSGSPKRKAVVLNVINYTCDFPATTSQKVTLSLFPAVPAAQKPARQHSRTDFTGSTLTYCFCLGTFSLTSNLVINFLLDYKLSEHPITCSLPCQRSFVDLSNHLMITALLIEMMVKPTQTTPQLN